ncbi:MAG: von Willebrand factor type A domain-containing protein [Anaerolineales bacterium]
MTQRRFTSLLLVLVATAVTACASAQDASKAYSRAAINRGAIVSAENIRVHEYLNYYEQRFPNPTNEPLGLDVRLGNPEIPINGGPVWLQIGLQARAAEKVERTPLNLALVLDTSGSMDAPDKMPYLKQSLMVFLGSLRPEDQVALVTYDDTAHLLWQSQLVGDGGWIRDTVESLWPGGSTNLHAGLMLGLQEVERNFDIRRNNRVILLTDGIANRGVTDAGRIAREALSYNERGIYLSTIGLGLDFNDQLLTTLAQQGRGAYHFVDSAQEMDKVFRQEVEGLVQRVANDVRISILPEPGVKLQMVTGFEGSPPAAGAQVVLQDMGAGDSQVLMVQVQAGAGAIGSRPLAQITLSYFDVFAQRPREATQMVGIHTADVSRYDPLADIEVLRNATIVSSAEALIAIDDLFNNARYESAFYMAQAMEQDLRRVAALAGDGQMVEDADLFARYQVTLSNALGYDPSSPPQAPSGYQPPRWGPTQVAPLPTLGLDG